MSVPAPASRCDRCLLAAHLCICGEIPTIGHRTEVVIVRHAAERFRSSNTGRIAALALASARLFDYAPGPAPAAPLVAGLGARPTLGAGVTHPGAADAGAPPAFDRDGAWLVFPEGEPAGPPSPPPRRLVFVDATWPQARRMRQRLDALRGLPVWHLPIAHVPAARLRESPGGGRVSTIEAIAEALRLVDGDAPADALGRLFGLLVERARRSGRRGAAPA